MELPDRFIHQATRYVLGRTSYAVGFHCDWLVANWPNIPEEERQVIKRDVEEAFERDDRARQSGGPTFKPLGMDMDRQCWERVRELWNGTAATPEPGLREE